MTLSEKDIRHIATLARLKLTDSEVSQYRTELGGILRYVDQLKNISFKSNNLVNKLTISNNLRNDQVDEWLIDEVEIALQQAPDRQATQYKVKRILK